MNKGFELTKFVKCEKLSKGWLFSGIPKMDKNPKQVHLNVESVTSKYVLSIRNRTKWSPLDDYKELKRKWRDVKCSMCLTELWRYGKFTEYCCACKYPSPPTAVLINTFCRDWFKYADERELAEKQAFTWMLIWTFHQDKSPFPQRRDQMGDRIRFPRVIAKKIAMLIIKREEVEECRDRKRLKTETN